MDSALGDGKPSKVNPNDKTDHSLPFLPALLTLRSVWLSTQPMWCTDLWWPVAKVTRFREIQRLSQDSGRLSQHLSSVVDARKHGLDATFDKPPEASTVAFLR